MIKGTWKATKGAWKALFLVLQETIITADDEITVFDIKEMFNAINTDKLLEIIARNMDYQEYNTDTIMDMIKYDTKEANWVANENKLYKQNKGIPMGSPSSTIYAKIYTDYFIMINWSELKRNGMNKIHKYVDDILIIHEKGAENKLKSILEQEMMLELKMDNSHEEIEYLDIIIYKRNNQLLETKWNKKAYVSNRSIHRHSQINGKIKEATFINRIIRTTRITSEKHLYDSLQINIEEFINNGYHITWIRKLMEKTINKITDANFLNSTEKLKPLKECLNTLDTKIRKNKISTIPTTSSSNHWKEIFKDTKCRQTNKKARFKAILQRGKIAEKCIQKSRYIRIPRNIGKANIHKNVKNIFKDGTKTVYTTRKNKKNR